MSDTVCTSARCMLLTLDAPQESLTNESISYTLVMRMSPIISEESSVSARHTGGGGSRAVLGVSDDERSHGCALKSN